MYHINKVIRIDSHFSQKVNPCKSLICKDFSWGLTMLSEHGIVKYNQEKERKNMYKGYQEEMFKNPWGVNEGFKDLCDKLTELLPIEGRCEFPKTKNKHLEKFRRAQNAAL